MPITLASYTGIPAADSIHATGWINFLRNIGSSVGTSMVTKVLARRAQFHQLVLSYHHQLRSHVSEPGSRGGPATDALRDQRGRCSDPGVRNDLPIDSGAGSALAYIDVYQVLAFGAVIMFLLAFIIRKNDPQAGGEGPRLESTRAKS